MIIIKRADGYTIKTGHCEIGGLTFEDLLKLI
jgi:hypothetical protein